MTGGERGDRSDRRSGLAKLGSSPGLLIRAGWATLLVVSPSTGLGMLGGDTTEAARWEGWSSR